MIFTVTPQQQEQHVQQLWISCNAWLTQKNCGSNCMKTKQIARNQNEGNPPITSAILSRNLEI